MEGLSHEISYETFILPSACSFIFTHFFNPQILAQDFVRLGKVGEWNNNYGYFRAVDVKEINEVIYAFWATSRGMAIFSISYENTR